MEQDEESQDHDGGLLPLEVDREVKLETGKSLYVSHFLSTWNARGFEFGAVLFLASIYPNTLLPMSVYALVRSAAAIVFSPLIGQYVDSNNRLKVARYSILGQRLAVSLSCLVFLGLLQWHEKMTTMISVLLFISLTLLASIEKLSFTMNTVAIERDWVVVLAEQNETLLQIINAQMRRIDLFCKLISPFAIALVDSWSSKIAVISTLGINLISVGIEYLLIARVFESHPALARRESDSSQIQPNEGQVTHQESQMQNTSKSYAKNIHQFLKTYIKSEAFLPSFALCILHLTVLSFSGQMTTFLLSQPYTSLTVGILRTASVTMEISSTYLAPYMMMKTSLGPTRAGIWFLSFQALCLTSAVGMLWSTKSIPAFITGVILSRTGLWSFDLTAQLIIQETVESSNRGSFSATESSLQNFFELCTYISTIIFSKSDQFKYPAVISLGAVYFAAAVYAKFVRDRRGHLFHLPPCITDVKSSTNWRYGMVDST